MLVNVSCELVHTMTRYEPQEDVRVILSNVQTDSQLDIVHFLSAFHVN